MKISGRRTRKIKTYVVVIIILIAMEALLSFSYHKAMLLSISSKNSTPPGNDFALSMNNGVCKSWSIDDLDKQ